MKWVLLGVRKAPILDKNLKLEAWSKGLKREIGQGYTEFITTKEGSQFVLTEDDEKILRKIDRSKLSFKYVDEMEEVNKKIAKELKSKQIDYIKILNLLIDQLVYFYLAKENLDRIYISKSVTNNGKRKIEQWRNNDNLFSSDYAVSKSLTKKLKIAKNILNDLTLEELNSALNNKPIDPEKIKLRSKNSWSLVLKNGKIKLFLKDLSPIKNKVTNIKIINGKSAFKLNRKITGIVGQDILVTTMTHPGMLQTVKKMKAIITDEGGVLSHAAITAREFKIPTIIGTKIATQVLKDGDRVEIDANKGVVRKIN